MEPNNSYKAFSKIHASRTGQRTEEPRPSGCSENIGLSRIISSHRLDHFEKLIAPSVEPLRNCSTLIIAIEAKDSNHASTLSVAFVFMSVKFTGHGA